MARDYYQWWEVTADYIQVKFVDSLDSTTLINDNVTLYDSVSSPTVVTDPFKTITVSTDFSSISRILTLWWADGLALPTATYVLEFSGLKDFLQADLATFTITFDWVANLATPNTDLQPTREPIEVEDYSIKTPGWSIIDTSVTTETATPTDSLVILDLLPQTSIHHYLAVDENEGRIDILFNKAIASNYITNFYFKLESKEVKKGISLWETMDTLVLGNLDNTIVSVYLPGVAIVDPATPSDPVYSYLMTEEEIADYYWFEEQTKYRLTISSQVGTP